MKVLKGTNLIEFLTILLLALIIIIPAITDVMNTKQVKDINQSNIYCDYQAASGSLG